MLYFTVVLGFAVNCDPLDLMTPLPVPFAHGFVHANQVTRRHMGSAVSVD